MKRMAGVLALIGLVSLACSGATIRKQTEVRAMEHDGKMRRYLLHRPTVEGAGPQPLLIALHGGAASPEALASTSQHRLDLAADAHGFVVAYPDGIKGRWNDGRGEPGNDEDDAGFLLALVDELADEGLVDPDHVAVTGLSAGAMMAFRMACEHPDRIAAIAPIAGGLPEVWLTKCAGPPVGLLYVHGTADPVLPYLGGTFELFGQDLGRVVGAEATVGLWAQRNGCGSPPVATAYPDPAEDGLSTGMVACEGDKPVVHLRIEGGGHGWPGSAQVIPEAMIGRTTTDFTVANAIVEHLHPW